MQTATMTAIRTPEMGDAMSDTTTRTVASSVFPAASVTDRVTTYSPSLSNLRVTVVPRVRRKGDGPRLTWSFKRRRRLRELESLDGNWLLLSTDAKLSVKEVVNTYLEKDFIEKVFRTLKTSEEVEPVRHRLERRVRAYLFLCVLAYRLLAVLPHGLGEISTREDRWERGDTLLGELARVERVQVRLGHQVKTWYLNVSGDSRDVLDKMGYKKLLMDTVEVDFKM